MYSVPAVKMVCGLVVLAVVAGAASCRAAGVGSRSPIVQPGAPGQSSQAVSAGTAAAVKPPAYTEADVKFMQGMIAHHLQAIDMVALLKERSNDPDMKKLALRMEVSQNDEIKMMRRWLEDRGQDVPGPHAHHMMHGDQLMPGMLNEEELAKLEAAKGVEFDTLFLEGMMKHHGGALIMVKDLFGTPGAGQATEMYAFASDVDTDQRMEIERMRIMLRERQK